MAHKYSPLDLNTEAVNASPETKKSAGSSLKDAFLLDQDFRPYGDSDSGNEENVPAAFVASLTNQHLQEESFGSYPKNQFTDVERAQWSPAKEFYSHNDTPLASENEEDKATRSESESETKPTVIGNTPPVDLLTTLNRSEELDVVPMNSMQDKDEPLTETTATHGPLLQQDETVDMPADSAMATQHPQSQPDSAILNPALSFSVENTSVNPSAFKPAPREIHSKPQSAKLSNGSISESEKSEKTVNQPKLTSIPSQGISSETPSSMSDPMKDVLKAAQNELERAALEKAQMEGQLEAITEECQAALSERASLHRKVAQLEAKICTFENKDKETRNSEIVALKEKIGSISAKYQGIQMALEKERKINDELRNKIHSQRLQKMTPTHGSLELERHEASKLKETVESLESSLDTARSEADEKSKLVAELMQKEKLHAATVESLQKSNSWLQQQLKDSMDARTKLQEDVHVAKAAGISHKIHLDEARKEVVLYQQRVSDLQQELMKDKTKLVHQLEKIEADVLSQEDSYQNIMHEKQAVCNQLAQKEIETEALRAMVEETATEKSNLEDLLAKAEENIRFLTGRAENVEKEKLAWKEQTATTHYSLEDKDRNIITLSGEIGSLKGELQGKEIQLKQKETELMALRNSKELTEKEVDLARQQNLAVESELTKANDTISRLETRLETLNDSVQESEEDMNTVIANRDTLANEVAHLRQIVSEKEGQLTQRVAEVQSMSGQVSELVSSLQSLQKQYDGLHSVDNDSISILHGKEKMIQELLEKKQLLESELANIQTTNVDLQAKVTLLSQQKAHLEGQLDAISQRDNTAESMDQVLRDKIALQADLSEEKLKHQQDEFKHQAKANRLESDLKAAKKELTKMEKLYRKLQQDNIQVEVLRQEGSQKDMTELRSQLDFVTKERNQAVEDLLRSQTEIQENRREIEQLKLENKGLVDHLQKISHQMEEFEKAHQSKVAEILQLTEKERENLTASVRQLSLELERYRGRLAGISRAQVAMKKHTEALETALADRESSLVKLSAENQGFLEQRELENRSFMTKLSVLENENETLKLEVESCKCQLVTQDKEIQVLSDEVNEKNATIAELNTTLEKAENWEGSKAKKLEQERRITDQLQASCEALRSELDTQVSLVGTYQLEIKDQMQKVNILEKELQMARSGNEEALAEMEKLKEYHQVAEERRLAEIGSLQGALDEAMAEKNRLREKMFARLQEEASTPQHTSTPLSGTSLSSATESAQKSTKAIEDIDLAMMECDTRVDDPVQTQLMEQLAKVEAMNDHLRKSGQNAVGQVLVYKKLLRKQEEDMAKRLEQTRKHEQESVELKKSAEIAVLRNELGYKHKTVDSLNTTLSVLKKDMSKLQTQMDRHSAAVRASYLSSRQLENQLEDLRRSSKVSSPLTDLSPSISTQGEVIHS